MKVPELGVSLLEVFEYLVAFACPVFSDHDVLIQEKACTVTWPNGTTSEGWGRGSYVEFSEHNPIMSSDAFSISAIQNCLYSDMLYSRPSLCFYCYGSHLLRYMNAFWSFRLSFQLEAKPQSASEGCLNTHKRFTHHHARSIQRNGVPRVLRRCLMPSSAFFSRPYLAMNLYPEV
ncbi:hypothetical protein BDN70DRAFT_298114 [Pholiota conissans]|uniref:Uncharacterized protein n=1 Tax=Pholiota conissans TaxID=109636 RepID=A0A9P6CVE6_9AGAR|nr:hypothetical protein BDN70DRAFT_298114 [Pholiota conissans]